MSEVHFFPLDVVLSIKSKRLIPAGFSGVRPGQCPVRSLSMDGSMGPSPARPFTPQHRNSGPYSLLQQQQQQGLMGTHGCMPNQAAMTNTGEDQTLVEMI